MPGILGSQKQNTTQSQQPSRGGILGKKNQQPVELNMPEEQGNILDLLTGNTDMRQNNEIALRGNSTPKIKPQLPIGKAGLVKLNPINENKMIPVGKAGIIKTQARNFDNADALAVGAIQGTGKIALDTLNLINSYLQAPATLGVRGKEGGEQAVTEGKNQLLGILKGYGQGLKDVVTGQNTVENTQFIETGLPKQTEALKQKFPKTYSAVSTIVNLFGVDDLTAIGLIGDIAKVRKLGLLPQTTAELAKAAAPGLKSSQNIQSIIDSLPDDTLKAIDNIPPQEVEDYYGMVGYLDEVNRGTLEYIKAEARMNVPRAKEIKTLTKNVGAPELEIDMPKVTIKKERYIPSVSDIIDNKKKPVVRTYKTPGLGGEPVGEGYWKNTYLEEAQGNSAVHSDTGAGMDSAKRLEGIRREREILEEQYKRVKNLSDVEYWELARKGYLTEADYYKYVEPRESLYPHEKETILKNIQESKLEGRGKKDSGITFNEWYYRREKKPFNEQDYYKTDYRVDLEIGKGKSQDKAVKAVIASEKADYKKFIKDAIKREEVIYPKAKFKNTVTASIDTQKIPQPSIIKGQTLKPNRPILSVLDAKINKSYVKPIPVKNEILDGLIKPEAKAASSGVQSVDTIKILPEATDEVAIQNKIYKDYYNEYRNAKTGESFEIESYQGRGKTRGQIYNYSDKPVLGDAQYYAPNYKEASQYGAVSKVQIKLSNPLVISNDSDWRKLTSEAGWRYPNLAGLEKDEVSKNVEDMKELILSKGHDGVIINIDRNSDNTKTMKNMFSHSQIIVYDDIKVQKLPSKTLPQTTKNEILDSLINPKTASGGVQASTGVPSLIDNLISGGTSKEVIKRSEIEKFISDTLDIPVAQGKFRQKALGIFKVKPEVIRLKQTKDLDTLFHEVGHFLDKKFKLASSQFDNELQALGRVTSRASYTKDQIRDEGVAEFMRHYMIDPQQAQQKAPNFYRAFESIVKQDQNITDMIGTVQAAVKNYTAQAPETRILSNVSVGGKTQKAPVTLEKIYAKTIDELDPLKRAVDEITGGAKIATSDNPYELAWLNRGWQGKAETYLKYGAVDENFNRIGKSFEEILKPVIKNLDEFRQYSVAKRAEELAKRGIETGLNAGDVAATIAKLNGKGYDDVLKELVTYQDNVLNQLVQTGILDKEAVNAMRKLNENYVPFYRVLEGAKGGTGKGLLAKNPVKSIKGSTRDIVDPLESIIKNTYVVTQMAERNRVGKALVELAEKYDGAGKLLDKVPPKMIGQSFQLQDIKKALADAGADVENIDLEKVASIFRPVGYNSKDKVITVFRNGKPEYFEVFDEDLYRSMLTLDKETSNTLVRLLSFPAKLLRAGATLTPEFALRNPVRDAFTAFVNSKYGFVPGVDTAKGLFHALKKDDLYYKWLSSGGANGALVSLDRDYLQGNLRKLLQTSMKDKTLNIIKNPVEAMRAFSEFTEQATRLGEFAKGIKKEGMTAEGLRKAALSSRDVALDFSRVGTATKPANQMIAFFNAQLQGLDKMVRIFKENPVKSTTKAITGITLPSVLLYQLNKDDPRYQELPQWQKDLFWIIPTEKALYRIPKPFELGILFGTLPERIMQWIDTNDPKAFEGLGERALDGFAPEFLPTALKPIIESMANYSFFTGRQITSMSDQNVEPYAQYDAYTSDTAKLLGSLLNASPKKIDNAIKGYGGGLARYGTDILDSLLQASGAVEKNVMPKDDFTKLPGIKGFTTRPYTGGSDSLDKFYKELNSLEKQFNTEKRTNKELEAPDKLKAYRKISSMLSDIRKAEKEITESDKLSAEQKREYLDRLNMAKIDIARKVQGKEKVQQ